MESPTPAPVLVTPKRWWTSRTLWAGIIATLAGLGSLAPQIPGKAGSVVSIASGIAAIWLRTQTAAPIVGTKAAAEAVP
jgi:hypothetical protein